MMSVQPLMMRCTEAGDGILSLRDVNGRSSLILGVAEKLNMQLVLLLLRLSSLLRRIFVNVVVVHQWSGGCSVFLVQLCRRLGKLIKHWRKKLISDVDKFLLQCNCKYQNENFYSDESKDDRKWLEIVSKEDHSEDNPKDEPIDRFHFDDLSICVCQGQLEVHPKIKLKRDDCFHTLLNVLNKSVTQSIIFRSSHPVWLDPFSIESLAVLPLVPG
mmetsp:Transcript_25125/g.56724  ORF Transcript_25125/g.56724 Transcript_25125/m.56724 type:complete len:215 (-) Transcript_25125:625-1269(-)